MDKLTYIKNHYQEKNDQQLATDLEMIPQSVKKLRIENKIFRRHRYPWLPPELKKLQRIYPNANPEQLEWEFDRSRHSIKAKASRENISRSKEKIKEVRSRAGSKKAKSKPQVKIVL